MKQWVLGRWKKRALTQVLGFSAMAEGLAMATRQITEGKSRIAHCHFFENTGPEHEGANLRTYLKAHGLNKVPGNFVLPVKAYDSFLVEMPDVSEGEMKQALKWKVADMLDFPIEQGLVDYIHLPYEKNPKQNMAYVLVCQKQRIEQWQTWFAAQGVVLRKIDIIESTLRQMMQEVHASPNETQALVWLNPTQSQLIVLKASVVHMMRGLELNVSKILGPQEDNDDLEELVVQRIMHDLALEIQRSLDYCTSNLSPIQVQKIQFAPLPMEGSLLLQETQQSLKIPTSMVDLGKSLEFESTPSSRLMAQCFTAIGATFV